MPTLTPPERTLLIAAVGSAWLRLVAANATEADVARLLLCKLADARTITIDTL
jgi:hypothetical protein